MTSTVPKLLRLPQVAESTGLPMWRLYDLVAQGRLPHLRAGKVIMVSEHALARWIDAEHQASVGAGEDES